MADSYLYKTQGTGSSYDIWTLSMWVKRSGLGSIQGLMSTAGGWNDGTGMAIVFSDTDVINIYNPSQGGGGGNYNLCTRKFRDTNAWYHLVFRADSTQGTQADRMKVYVNGVQETTFNMGNLPSQGTDWNNVNKNGQTLQIGRGGSAGSTFFDGYMSHVSFADGQSLAPTVFGETDSTSGIWKFKQPSGVTWGTNGFHLKFENSGALGTDSSGNSNTFTVGGNGRQALDTPSNVYATLNPLVPTNTFSGNFSNGNTSVLGKSDAKGVVWSTLGASTGKYYFEAKIASSDDIAIGITNDAIGLNTWSPSTGNYVFYANNGAIYRPSGQTASGTTFTTNDIIGVAWNATASEVTFYKNGSAIASAYGVEGTQGTMFIAVSDTSTSPTATVNFNFGNGYFGTTAISSAGSNGNGSLFEYDVPSGYYALNTKNINTYG